MKMRMTSVAALMGAALAVTAVPAARAQGALVGKPAPAFTVKDSNGRTRSLSQFKGKTVVLEWLNHGCPYVRKHYGGGNMQKLQKQYTGQGVVWLSVISSKPGTQGYSTPEEANATAREKGAAPTAILLDSDTQMARTYGAKTTPHMFVINPQGVLVYNGAIDDKPTARVSDLSTANNYVAAAISAVKARRPVATAATQPYGCGVKY